MVDINKLKQQAKEAAEKGLIKDQSVDTGPDIKYEPPAKGLCYARLVSYIEIGKHVAGIDKHGKGPVASAVIQFELLGKKHAKEIEVNGVKKVIYPVMTERVNISNSKKSWFYKLLHALDYGRGNTHIAFMVGDAFKVNVIHVEAEKDGNKVVYANIRDDSGWKVSAPTSEVTDDEGNVEIRNVKVGEPTVPLRLMLWDSPTIEMWESIFIDGTFTRTVEGKEVEVSRNINQVQITEAANFEGSPVQTMLLQSTGGLPGKPEVDDADELDEPDEPDEEDDVTEDAETDADDPLAGLDLD